MRTGQTLYDRLTEKRRRKFKQSKTRRVCYSLISDTGKRVGVIYIRKPLDGFNWKIVTDNMNVYGLIVHNAVQSFGKEKKDTITATAKSKFLYCAKTLSTLLIPGTITHANEFMVVLKKVAFESGLDHNGKLKAKPKKNWDKLPENVKKVINKTLKAHI